jgi:hypothetical protein
VKHFELEQLLDFVRGLATEGDRAAMQDHLSAGCRKCGRALAMFRKLAAASAADTTYTVPDYAVRSARAIFALQRPEKVHILPRILARLVYDSFREPALAGVRSQHKITRQAMYEAGDYCVDLRMEQERGAINVVLVGQIANRMEPRKKMASVPIVLMSGKQVLGRAVSNRLGEFQIEYQPQKSLSLHVPVQQAGTKIEVPLKDLFDSGRK